MKTQLNLPFPASYPGSFNIHILGLCLTLITACSVFKEKSFYQADSLQRQEIKTEIKNESAMGRQALRIYTSSDSTDKQSYAEIFPRGPFRYSVADGFSGEAERVIINDRVKERKWRAQSVRLTQTNSNRSDMKGSEKVRTETRLKKKDLQTTNVNWLYLAGASLIIAFIYVFRRYFVHMR